MSVSNLNEFPIHNILTLNLTTTQLTVLIVGLIKFMLLQILLHRKMISAFFLGFNSHSSTSPVLPNHGDSSDEGGLEDEEADDRSNIGRGGVETVLRRLGMSCGEDERLPSRLNAGGIFEMFEERSPSLEEVREAFDVFDSGRDGFIDERELQKVLEALGLEEGSEVENCRRMIAAFDEDGDGRIDFGEFVKIMESTSC